jgi:hypothetical protein
MSVKVTLSIPDDLAERVDKFRDRLNQSAIFADAIRKEVATLELTNDLGDLSAAIARLRPQRDSFERDVYQIGFRVGVQWAKDWATYEELVGCAMNIAQQITDSSLGATTRKESRKLNTAVDEALIDAGYLSKQEPKESPRSQIGRFWRLKPYDQDSLDRGLGEGVKKVWAAIRKTL